MKQRPIVIMNPDVQARWKTGAARERDVIRGQFEQLAEVLEALAKQRARELSPSNQRRLSGAQQFITDIINSSQWRR